MARAAVDVFKTIKLTMKTLISSLTILLVLSAFGQEIECQYPPSRNFTGTCEAFYTDGSIKVRTDFTESLRNGNHVEYFRNGNIAATAVFSMESYIGPAFRYSETGAVTFKMELDSSETGVFTRYSNDGKTVLATGQFKKGYRDGVWNYYTSDGSLKEVARFNSDSLRQEIYGDGTSKDIFIPYEETIDRLFLEICGLPIEIWPETIVDDPDIYAEFPGGVSAMKKFIQNEVIYPKDALKEKKTGKVYLSFIIEQDGTLTDIKVFKSAFPSLDEEAKRIVGSMPKWTPARYNEQTVRSKCYLPITFTL